ncbi:MAG: glycosyltransferase [Bacteroidales bacterium]|nr:glycosyltransferase [Bacteroidales bacterium]
MKLSIIVPVYNVEAYLQKCVASLLDQDLSKEDYEIILVDDGSTDGSAALCDTFAAEQGNIRVIHQPNRGLSGTRNTGIAAATAEYIQFVDSDDFLTPKVLGSLVGQMEKRELDVLRFNYQDVNMAGEVFEPNKYVKPYVDFSGEVCDGLTFLNERLGFACYACQFIVKAALLQREGNGFKEGIYFEDVEWTPRILVQAGRVASTDTVVYNYLFRTDSIARNTDLEKKRKAIRDKMTILDGFDVLRRQVRDDRWFKGMTAQVALSCLVIVGQYFFPQRKEYIKMLRKRVFFPLSAYHATKSARWKIWLANVSPSLVCRFYHRK